MAKNRVVIDANRVSVNARPRGLPELASEKARSRMLGNLVRAYEKAFASSALSKFLTSTAPFPNSSDEATLRQQIADNQLTASKIPQLRKDVSDLANQITFLNKEWARYVGALNRTQREMDTRLRNELVAISSRINRKGQTTPSEQSAAVSLATTKRISNETLKAQLITQARDRKNTLREQAETINLQLLQKQQDLQNAQQAVAQTKDLQRQLNQIIKMARGTVGTVAGLLRPTPLKTTFLKTRKLKLPARPRKPKSLKTR